MREPHLSFSTFGPAAKVDTFTARDVFNEKPATDELVAAEGEAAGPAAVLPRGAVIHTTRGDIWVKLFPDECPKTVENFTTHARNGYYDGIIFHRVIKGFMIQTGDPLGARCKPTSHQSVKGFSLPWGLECRAEVQHAFQVTIGGQRRSV